MNWGKMGRWMENMGKWEWMEVLKFFFEMADGHVGTMMRKRRWIHGEKWMGTCIGWGDFRWKILGTMGGNMANELGKMDRKRMAHGTDGTLSSLAQNWGCSSYVWFAAFWVMDDHGKMWCFNTLNSNCPLKHYHLHGNKHGTWGIWNWLPMWDGFGIWKWVSDQFLWRCWQRKYWFD